MKKILLIGPDPSRDFHGGVVTHIKLLLSSRLNEKYSYFFQKIELKGKNIFIKACNIIIQYINLVKKIRNNEFDLVHVNISLYFTSLIKMVFIIIIAEWYGLKIVLQFHGGRINEVVFKRVFTCFLFKCDMILVLSMEQAKEFYNLNSKFREILNIIPNHIDINQFLINKKKNRSDNVLKILFLGRVVREKGIFDLIEAINLLNEKNKRRIKLIVAGDGKDLREIKSLCRQYNLKNIVKFVGFVVGKEKQKKLSLADLFILPSWSEGFPYVLLEAMAFKLPMIVTKTGAIPEIIEDGQNGLLISPRSIRELKEGLTYCIDNREVILKMGERNYNKLLQNYTMDNGVEKFDKIYKQII